MHAQANAIGSIFYVAGGLYNPELYKSAVTGVQPAGRKLLTNLPTLPTTTAKGPDGFPDPYGFIPAVRLIRPQFLRSKHTQCLKEQGKQ